MLARRIRWVLVDDGGAEVEKRARAQLFGGALVVGVLEPVLAAGAAAAAGGAGYQEAKAGRGRKKKQPGKGKGKGKARDESDISCHEPSHRRGPPPVAFRAAVNPAPLPRAAAARAHRTRRFPKGSPRPGPAPAVADSTYGSRDQSPPFHGTLHDTDAETLAAYGRAYTLHTEHGRPIIDGSLEYWEAVHRSPPAAASTTPRTVPTIRTESGRVLLQGTEDRVERG